ncbi:2013_t:CDS:2 [Funneliformis mosseae]|uniref:2013_t:CDS:1 n=1 Tax=Funneliformis mosseae TaxID=27381 RepID=A0A9N8V4V6_FUNMO|nr:2013_t:CDS:2 [Funneliformis mosseae]
MEVSDNAEEFPNILNILASVLNIKAVIRETMKARPLNEAICLTSSSVSLQLN